jgi:hypothetical protein
LPARKSIIFFYESWHRSMQIALKAPSLNRSAFGSFQLESADSN